MRWLDVGGDMWIEVVRPTRYEYIETMSYDCLVEIERYPLLRDTFAYQNKVE